MACLFQLTWSFQFLAVVKPVLKERQHIADAAEVEGAALHQGRVVVDGDADRPFVQQGFIYPARSAVAVQRQ